MRPNKKISVSVFQVTGLKILGRVGTQFFLNIFVSGKKICFFFKFMHFERYLAFQNA